MSDRTKRWAGSAEQEPLSVDFTNAIYHATGKRVRDLPITIEKLL